VDSSPTYEEAARRELYEEVGLDADMLTLVTEGRRSNPCRRPGGTWHDWKVYGASVPDWHVHPSRTETKRVVWMSTEDLVRAAERTDSLIRGTISDLEWHDRPGLEPVWAQWLALLLQATEESNG
jgi:8-oxo-dGTP pyrophosphatase MutT (NUDIX family)